MIVIANSSPLIALGRTTNLKIFKSLFGKIFIPDTVYQEVVVESNSDIQKDSILEALAEGYIEIETPKTNITFKRSIDRGERGVLNLAAEKNADLLIMDDKKAIKEAKALGYKHLFTSQLLKQAEQQGVISSYLQIYQELCNIGIFLPE